MTPPQLPTLPAAAARAEASRLKREAEKAAALRANLARRKAQARAQDAAPPGEEVSKCR